jgi:transposase
MAMKTHPPYPAEFRAEAARLARTSGQPLRATAQELGVSVEALRAWVKQGEIDAGDRDGLTSGEREELRRLRRENHVLRQEREILAKATAFFAKESATR